jgi:nucleotide-binding universal stress UspA family protein
MAMAMRVQDLIRPADPATDRRPINRVLVGFDGSPGAWAALDEGIAVAVRERALLTIAGVVREPVLWLGMGAAPVPYTPDALRTEAEREMERLLAAARDEVPATVSVTTRLLHGTPARALGELADKGGYDLVVVGPRRVTWLRRLLGAGVTHRLLSRVQASVLAVKTPAT